MAGKQSRSLQRDILMAEEQARRAKEMTEEAIHETDVAMKANRELTAKLVDLQAGFQALTDEEISREFTTLRHDMVQWSFTHFQDPTTPDGHAPLGLSQGGATLKLDSVRLELSKAIYKGFLSPHIVGEGLAGSEHLLDVDLETQRICGCTSLMPYIDAFSNDCRFHSCCTSLARSNERCCILTQPRKNGKNGC